MATDKQFNIARGNLAHSQGILDQLHSQNMAQPSPEMAAPMPQSTPQSVQAPVSPEKQSPFDTFQLPPQTAAVAQAPAATGAAISPQYAVKDRGVQVNNEDLGQLRKVLYAEIGSRSPDKTELEARTVANIALNRLKNKFGDGQSLSDILTAPKQFQGYGSHLYQNFESDSKTASGTKRLQIIDKVLGEIKAGNFPDNVGGYQYYTHTPDGRINATKEYGK